MVKLTSLTLVILTICIATIGVSCIFKQMLDQTTVTPTDTPAATATPKPTGLSSPSPTPTPGPVPVKSVQWAGHTWDVTDYAGNAFSSDNVWVDSGGRLHMRLIYDGQWHDFNLIQRDKVGYGTFKWTIATNIDYIQDRQDGGNPYFLFSPFLFDNSNPGQNYGELDIEMCRWGRINQSTNMDWTIHPANHLVQSEHVVGAGNTWTLEWMPDHIKFSVEGPSQPYREYVFTDASHISSNTGGMASLLTIGQYRKSAPPDNKPYYEADVVLLGYEYIPYDKNTKATPTVASQSQIESLTAMPDKRISSIQWSGHTWDVTDYAGGSFTSDNVWVDSGGRLHMKLIYDGQWHGFNLIQQDPIGYGTFKWTVDSDIDPILDWQDGGNPYFLFSPFLFDSSNNGEIDIQVSKWGVTNAQNNTNWNIGQANHMVGSEHVVGAGNTWTLEWMPDHIKFSVEGPSQPYREYVFTDASQIPVNKGLMKSILTIGQFKDYTLRSNLTYYGAEIVLNDYQYIPYKPVQ